MRSVISIVLAGFVATAGSGCTGLGLVHQSDVAPRQALHPGSRVRVQLVQPRSEVVGKVVRIGADTLVILPEDNSPNELVLPASNVRRVEISFGRRGHWGAGAVVGLLAGAGLGVFPIGGALVGLGLGAGVGALIRTEWWREVTW